MCVYTPGKLGYIVDLLAEARREVQALRCGAGGDINKVHALLGNLDNNLADVIHIDTNKIQGEEVWDMK